MKYKDKIKEFQYRQPIHSVHLKKDHRFYVYRAKIDPSSYEKQKILEFILEKFQTDSKSINSPLSCWQTGYDLHLTTDIFNDLIEKINSEINKFIEEKNKVLKIKELWAAVYQKNDYAGLHDHGRFCFYSGVLYLQSDKEHPPIVFEDGFQISCDQDHMYFFDSKYAHKVPQNTLDSLRIVLGFNFDII